MESLRALVNFACNASDLNPQIIVRLIAYIRYLAVFHWQEPPFSTSPALVDTTTYTLASGLLELAYKNSVLDENITAVLWALAKRITEIILGQDGWTQFFFKEDKHLLTLDISRVHCLVCVACICWTPPCISTFSLHIQTGTAYINME